MTAGGLEVYVNRVEAAGPITDEDVVRAVAVVTEGEGVARGEISVTFVDALAMAALNETHLECDGPTDVIAFNLSEPSEPLGDVYVCPDVAAAAAREWGVELREELLRLVVHGVLHVVGYDHPEGPERLDSEMFRRQEELLTRLLG